VRWQRSKEQRGHRGLQGAGGRARYLASASSIHCAATEGQLPLTTARLHAAQGLLVASWLPCAARPAVGGGQGSCSCSALPKYL
jgi:hypothetical protein